MSTANGLPDNLLNPGATTAGPTSTNSGTAGTGSTATGSAMQTLTTPNVATTAAGTGTGLAQGATAKAATASTIPQADTVAAKVKELTSQDSALMQQAKTEGLKVANRRGLLNSSMAVGASQDAMISKALPIASQDSAQALQAGQAALDRDLQTTMQGRDITSREGLAAAQRELDIKMQENTISAADRQQIRDISSREGLAAAERALQELMQGKDISSREMLAGKERELQWNQSQQEIVNRTRELALDRDLQEKLASWNLKSADRNAAAQLLTNMETMYADAYSSIMANTNLDAGTRSAQLASVKALRDKQLNFVEQMYVIDLSW